MLFILFPTAAIYAQGLCSSNSGGYCLHLAALFPGLEFLGEIPTTSDLIARLYIFGLSLVGISALIMLVIGGVMYMTAGDSQSQVKQATSFMGNAVFGLVLALISWLVLFTINPNLVNKGFPRIVPLKTTAPSTAAPPASLEQPISGTTGETLRVGTENCQSSGGIPASGVSGIVCITPQMITRQRINTGVERTACISAGGRATIFSFSDPSGSLSRTFCSQPFK